MSWHAQSHEEFSKQRPCLSREHYRAGRINSSGKIRIFGICIPAGVPRKPQSPSFHQRCVADVDSLADCAFTSLKSISFVAEGLMRFVVIIVAALMSLGLAAFGVVSAQK